MRKTKEIEVEGKKISLTEIGFFDLVERNELKDKKEQLKKTLELSGVSKELIEDNSFWSIENGSKILKEINELNGWTDFQKT